MLTSLFSRKLAGSLLCNRTALPSAITLLHLGVGQGGKPCHDWVMTTFGSYRAIVIACNTKSDHVRGDHCGIFSNSQPHGSLGAPLGYEAKRQPNGFSTVFKRRNTIL